MMTLTSPEEKSKMRIEIDTLDDEIDQKTKKIRAERNITAAKAKTNLESKEATKKAAEDKIIKDKTDVENAKKAAEDKVIKDKKDEENAKKAAEDNRIKAQKASDNELWANNPIAYLDALKARQMKLNRSMMTLTSPEEKSKMRIEIDTLDEEIDQKTEKIRAERNITAPKAKTTPESKEERNVSAKAGGLLSKEEKKTSRSGGDDSAAGRTPRTRAQVETLQARIKELETQKKRDDSKIKTLEQLQSAKASQSVGPPDPEKFKGKLAQVRAWKAANTVGE